MFFRSKRDVDFGAARLIEKLAGEPKARLGRKPSACGGHELKEALFFVAGRKAPRRLGDIDGMAKLLEMGSQSPVKCRHRQLCSRCLTDIGQMTVRERQAPGKAFGMDEIGLNFDEQRAVVPMHPLPFLGVRVLLGQDEPV